ncbi:MAG: prepilin-type N-terminal cleavage/methylation domain-containing protein [Planctomycetota bacterium]
MADLFPFRRTRPGLQRPGFSLVELLVVLGVISILIVILMPVLAGSRDEAKRIQCLSNIRQLHVGFELYAADNDGYVPSEDSPLTWDALIQPYIAEERERVWECPADADGFYDDYATSYEIRDWFAVDLDYPERSLATKRLEEATADVILLFDGMPGWHAPDTRNASTVDGSARTYEEDDFQDNLLLVP